MDQVLFGVFHTLVNMTPAVFQTCQYLADRAPWVVSVVVLVALWFTGKPDDRTEQGELTRSESRRRVILIMIGAVTVFAAGHALAGWIERPAPLESATLSASINPEVWAGIISNYSRSRALPADQIAFWFALVGGLWRYHWRSGLAATVVALLFSGMRVGLGSVWATDVLAGAVLGLLASLFVFAVRPRLTWFTNPVVEFFETFPAIAYPISLLFLYDLTHSMVWQFGILALLFNIRGGQ